MSQLTCRLDARKQGDMPSGGYAKSREPTGEKSTSDAERKKLPARDLEERAQAEAALKGPKTEPGVPGGGRY